MKKKITIDTNRLVGAIAVLKNYLDGAVYDAEQGAVDNFEFIEDCIYVHRLLEVTECCWSELKPDEYEERIKKVKNDEVHKNEN